MRVQHLRPWNANRLRRFFHGLRSTNLKLASVFLLVLATLAAQDMTSFLTPDVVRVGDKLACRCGGCKNTVGTCPMLHCGFSDPLRKRIYDMKNQGVSDKDVIASIVREQGVVALAQPQPLGIFVWLMPGIALAIGFLIYSRFVRKNRATPAVLTAGDQALIERFRAEVDREDDDLPRNPEATRNLDSRK